MRRLTMITLVAVLAIGISFLSSCDCAKSDVVEKMFKENEHPKNIFKTFYNIFKKNQEYELNSLEGFRRYKIFKANLKIIKAHNEGFSAYKLGITEYIDMTEEEFNSKFPAPAGPINNNYHQNQNRNRNNISYQSDILGDEINWVTKGYDTPIIRSTISDRSCLAAHTYTLEAYNFITKGELTRLSPQAIIDCVDYSNVEFDVDYEFLSRSIFYPESLYPFTDSKGSCRTGLSAQKIVRSPIYQYPLYGNVDSRTIYEMLKEGPFFFCFSSSARWSYKSGVYTDYRGSILCGYSSCYNGGAAVVGYGVDEKTGLQYWLAKTTLGEDWGENGYIRIARDDSKNNLGLSCLYLQPMSPEILQ